MGIPVKLQVFEGPLDLLLHLIEKNKIDIYDIPIVEITNQYMENIKAMQKEDLNIMSEFLVMAATLLDIKCRMLLPKEVNEEGEEEDPRQELVEVTLPDKLDYVTEYARSHRKFGFRALLKKQSSKVQVVVTFLAILQLMKEGVIFIEQDQPFDEIMITSKVEEV